MELFFVRNFRPGQGEITLCEEESRHASKVLRKTTGSPIELTDGAGHYIRGTISGKTGKRLLIRVENYRKASFPFGNQIDIALGIIRPNRLDWAVEKLVELGVRKIIPLICHYNSRKTIKHNHLEGVAVSALKQSGQFFLPPILPPTPIERWFELTGNSHATKFIFHTDGNDRKLSEMELQPSDSPVHLLIGPEGGFHPSEIEQALALDYATVSLGTNILRTETAAVAAVSQIKLLLNRED